MMKKIHEPGDGEDDMGDFGALAAMPVMDVRSCQHQS